MKNLTRRQFIFGIISALCALALAKYTGFMSALNKYGFKLPTKSIPGEILGASFSLGHKLRSGIFALPSRTIQKDVVIVGGGIAGLAAGYRLAKAGFKNFALLDLEKETGGNALSGKNSVSAYPWGAHYVPILTEEATAVKRLFEELGIITSYDLQGLPIYNEFYICADPHERLYIYGRWQDGLIPVIGITSGEEKQYKRFFAMMENYKSYKDSDGKRAFAIPIDKSSQDKELLSLDSITMEEWMNKQGFSSPNLRWYVNYCCRDDYGTTFQETSAWAGIHYFAARNGRAANTDSQNVVTWPEGNGRLAHKLAEPFKANIITRALTYNVTDRGGHITVNYWDDRQNQSVLIEAKTAIIATPRFVASRIIESENFSPSAEAFSYSPWAVANITLSRLPSGKGVPLCWDNVVFNSNLLGYVVATHQITQMKLINTVLTYYWPMSHLSPAEAREVALSLSYEDWQKIILKELLTIHPEIEGYVERMDLWIWGHAMVRPTKGFIWGKARKEALTQHPPIFTAHSDMSGISIFEEAYTHGVSAAERAMTFMNIPYRSEL